jgi:hypothetical protein
MSLARSNEGETLIPSFKLDKALGTWHLALGIWHLAFGIWLIFVSMFFLHFYVN